jgi:chromosome partitioning protein
MRSWIHAFMETGMPTIAVTTRKGGAGKTTITTAVAAHLAAGGVPVGILDLDPQGSASAWIAARGNNRAAIAHVRSKPSTLRDDLRKMAADGVSTVVVDTPPHSDAALAGAVEVADAVLLPSLPSAFDLHALASALETVKAFRRPAGVVLNAAVPNTLAIAESQAAVAEMGMPLIGILTRRMAWQYAAARGLGPSELDPSCQAAKEVDGLCRAILGLLDGAKQ